MNKVFIFLIMFCALASNVYSKDKLLIFWYGMGMGHIIPAKRIAQHAEQHFQKFNKTLETKLVDIRDFGLSDSVAEATGKQKYLSWALNESKQYNEFFQWHLERDPNEIKTNFNLHQMAKFLEKEKPTAVIAVFWGAAHALYHLKKTYDLDFSLGLLYTDYGVHKFAFMAPTLDQIFMPSKKLYSRITKKYPVLEPYKSSFNYSGIPVAMDVIEELNKMGKENAVKVINQTVGKDSVNKLDPKAFTVALARGGEAFIPLADLINQTRKKLSSTLKNKNYNILALSGGAKADKAELDAIAKQDKNVIIVQHVDNKDYLKYMKASDLLLTKPGGVTLTEAGLLGVPMIIMKGLGGQEQDNADEFVKHKMAFNIEDPNQIIEKIEDLARVPQKLDAMRAKQKEYFKDYNPGAISEWLYRSSLSNGNPNWHTLGPKLENKNYTKMLQDQFDLSTILLKNWFQYFMKISDVGKATKNSTLDNRFDELAKMYITKAIDKLDRKIDRYIKRIKEYKKYKEKNKDQRGLKASYPGPNINRTRWNYITALTYHCKFQKMRMEKCKIIKREYIDEVIRKLLHSVNKERRTIGDIFSTVKTWKYSKATLHKNLADYYSVVDNHTDASIHAEEALKLFAENNKNESMINIIGSNLAKSNKENAVKHYRNYLNKNPKLYSVRIDLAKLYIDMKRHDEADKELTIISNKPELTENEVFLVAASFIRINQDEKSFAVLEKALSTHHKNSLHLHAQYFKSLVREDKEAKEYKQKIDADPNRRAQLEQLKKQYRELLGKEVADIAKLPILIEDAL